jgi:ATP-dependent Zn protease
MEIRVKTLLAGIVLSDIKYNEHASNAKNDLNDAKEIVKSMIEEYGMGSEIVSSSKEVQTTINRLYNETKELLKTLHNAIDKVENIFYEKESITKDEVKEILNEIF